MTTTPIPAYAIVCTTKEGVPVKSDSANPLRERAPDWEEYE